MILIILEFLSFLLYLHYLMFGIGILSFQCKKVTYNGKDNTFKKIGKIVYNKIIKMYWRNGNEEKSQKVTYDYA